MNINNVELHCVEYKVLVALIYLANKQYEIKASSNEIAELIGYKKSGGTITYALRSLEKDNIIKKTGRGRYKIIYEIKREWDSR